MTYNEQVIIFGQSAIALADGLLSAFDRKDAEAIARERITTYAGGSAGTDAALVSFWANVLEHTRTLEQGTRIYGNKPFKLAALECCVERLRKEAL